MPHFVVVAYDKPGAEALRKAARPAHFAYIETILDRIAVAGPMRDADGHFLGSILIYDAEDVAAARALLEGDPYHQAGIWERADVVPFTAAAGTWIGGKSW